ncbi:Outer membrane protein SusF [bioreactor metagenome]|uniref:Outer membrane protein SusF n=1 Tax=bioreactor metagenome TaxID=1076179 RepID=A0A645HZQ7_9ZZZZ
MSVDGNKMKITTTASGELRLYANSSGSTVGGDWWRMEFVILNGKIEYRGNGGDQDRVTVAAGKTVTLDFNAGTGTIQ